MFRSRTFAIQYNIGIATVNRFDKVRDRKSHVDPVPGKVCVDLFKQQLLMKMVMVAG